MNREPLVLVAAMTLPTALAWVYFIRLSPATEADASPVLQVAYSASKFLQFALPVIWVGLTDRAALGLPRLTGRGMVPGLTFGLLVAAAAFALYYGVLADSSAFADVPPLVRAKVGQFGLGTPAGFIALAAFLSVVHAALEEYYWRWFVFGRLRRHVPAAVAAVVSGLAFAGHHVVVLDVYFPAAFWPLVVPLSLGIAVGGTVWAWLYQRSDSLAGPWISHLIVDVSLMAIGFDLLFRRP